MTALLALHQVHKAFPAADRSGPVTILDDIELEVNEGEVVALLGRSGSGKSTLLRLMAGLIAPSSGSIQHRGSPLQGVNPDVAIVFQSFALLPWLTVLDNTGVGLEAQGVAPDRIRERGLEALAMVGLEGYAEAYPRELSGGMRQRVGFARAFVLNPGLLFMDEPFSALDVLTAENLRQDIDELWAKGNFPAKAIVIVTHNIEEAVLLSDRVVLLGANPGVIRGIVNNPLPRPRDKQEPAFSALVEELYGYMTNPERPVASGTSSPKSELPGPRRPLLTALPSCRPASLTDLVTLLPKQKGRRLAELAGELALSDDDLLPLVEAGTLLGLLQDDGGKLQLSHHGRSLRKADESGQRQLLAQLMRERVPLVQTVERLLDRNRRGEVSGAIVLDLMDEHLTTPQAEQTFRTLVNWLRYANIAIYSQDSDRFQRAPLPPIG